MPGWRWALTRARSRVLPMRPAPAGPKVTSRRKKETGGGKMGLLSAEVVDLLSSHPGWALLIPHLFWLSEPKKKPLFTLFASAGSTPSAGMPL